MQNTLKIIATAAAALCALQAQAYTASITPNTSTSAVAGVTVETFEGAAVFARSGGTVYNYADGSLTGDGIYLLNSVSAQPKHFEGTVQDHWFSVAAGQSASITFAGGTSYVGFLWGSVDTYNTVSFYNGESLIASYVGGANGLANFEVPVGNGNQAASQYFNFFAPSITKVTFASSGNAFEIDNVAAAVPEPETYALMAAGLVAVAFMSRRQRAR